MKILIVEDTTNQPITHDMIAQFKKFLGKIINGKTFKVGTVIKASDRSYQLQLDGSFRRIERKPWNNKAERKRHLRERREERAWQRLRERLGNVGAAKTKYNKPTIQKVIQAAKSL
jgi:hypothetical protein